MRFPLIAQADLSPEQRPILPGYARRHREKLPGI